MFGLTASVVVQVALLSAGAQPYDDAARQSIENGQPLLVLVGTDWCPGCRTMKDGVLTRMESRGGLKQVNYATVNADDRSDLAGRLMKGNSVPQLIVFSKKADGGWHREQITGTASEAQVAAMIERARAAQAADTVMRTVSGGAVAGN
jgi:thioredoxin-like negative regulator of GroEL